MIEAHIDKSPLYICLNVARAQDVDTWYSLFTNLVKYAWPEFDRYVIRWLSTLVGGAYQGDWLCRIDDKCPK